MFLCVCGEHRVLVPTPSQIWAYPRACPTPVLVAPFPLQTYFLQSTRWLSLQQRNCSLFLVLLLSFRKLCVYFISSLYLRCLEKSLEHGVYPLNISRMNEGMEECMTGFPTNPIPLEPICDPNPLSNFILSVPILGVGGRWSECFIKLRDNTDRIKCL